MKIEEAIKLALANMIEDQLNISDVVVTSWNEEYNKAYFTGCDSCGYGGDDEGYEVDVYYMRGESMFSFTYTGSFADLIKELDR